MLGLKFLDHSLGPRKLKFLLLDVDYLTKWVEVEVVSKINVETVRYFYYKLMIYTFLLPKFIMSENESNRTSSTMIEFRQHLGIQIKFISVEHP